MLVLYLFKLYYIVIHRYYAVNFVHTYTAESTTSKDESDLGLDSLYYCGA